MHIAIKATTTQKAELLAKNAASGLTLQWVGEDDVLASITADAYVDLLFNHDFISADEFINNKPVFVHGVACTCRDIGRPNYYRLNAWNGFLQRSVIEVAAINDEAKPKADLVLKALGWQYVWAPDEPGLIAARILSMIINEAFYGLQDGISTPAEIDTAMQLGTSYPHGPFEWGRKIGLDSVYYLLKKLQQHYGSRYTPAALLEQEALKHVANS